MPGNSTYKLQKVATKKPHVGQIYHAHHTAHLIPDQLIPWLLAASLLFGLTILILALTAHT